MTGWHWPQYVFALIFVLSCCTHLSKQGQQKTDKYGQFSDFLGMAITIWLLYAGGFWTPAS